MPQRQVTVGSAVGLHARPAALVAKAAAGQSVPVTIAKDDTDPVPAGSVMNLMTLGAGHGDTVTIAAEDGPGADEAVHTVADLVARDLDEPSAAGHTS